MTREEALVKMADLCARSEQCPFDIARKLRLKGLSPTDIRLVLDELESRRFIDTARFARSFANDKVRFSGWGRIKIRAELAGRRIPPGDVSAALEQIDAADYEAALERVARQKTAALDLSVYGDKMKLMRYLLSRGFEPDASREVMNRIICRRSGGEE